MIAILHTIGMFDDMEKDSDYHTWKEIEEIMDGEKAIVVPSEISNDYVFIGLLDNDKNKKIFYRKEQDSVIGMYINDREEFDRVWHSGKYDPDGALYIKQKYVEIINKS